MNAPQLQLKPSRDRKAYRLHCRFKIEPYPREERLDREKVRLAEIFVADMHKRGWEYVERFGFKMTGPFPMVQPVSIHVPSLLSAKQMLSGVANGQRFRDEGHDYASLVPSLDMTEYWDFDLEGVFHRPQLMVEYADPHEEKLA